MHFQKNIKKEHKKEGAFFLFAARGPGPVAPRARGNKNKDQKSEKCTFSITPNIQNTTHTQTKQD